ncbi:MAG: 30S ribosomal protein S21 [bacterium]|nr:30S ribosomal protein S21 [bacterium]
MPLHLIRKESESVGSFLYRFNKKVQHSGLTKEVKKRQFRSRPKNKRQRRAGALYRAKKQGEVLRERKQGLPVRQAGRR